MKTRFLGTLALCIGLFSSPTFAARDICCGHCTFYSDGTFMCSDCYEC
jgi:hypothetical protein